MLSEQTTQVRELRQRISLLEAELAYHGGVIPRALPSRTPPAVVYHTVVTTLSQAVLHATFLGSGERVDEFSLSEQSFPQGETLSAATAAAAAAFSVPQTASASLENEQALMQGSIASLESDLAPGSPQADSKAAVASLSERELEAKRRADLKRKLEEEAQQSKNKKRKKNVL